MADDLLQEILFVELDERTTFGCLIAAGQVIQAGGEFETGHGVGRPPFHVNCRSYVMPYVYGMPNDLADQARVELDRRGPERNAKDAARKLPPAREVQPAIAAEAGPTIPSDAKLAMSMEADEARRVELLTETFTFRHGPMRTENIRVGIEDVRMGKYPRAGARVSGDIVDVDGKNVGKFTRVLHQDWEDGHLYVDHADIQIAANMQGQGFATAFNRNAEAWYRGIGVTEIRLMAGKDVGGYAWAKAGYEFQTGNDLFAVLSKGKGHARELPDGPVKRQWDAWMREVDAAATLDDLTFTPLDLAMWGYEEGAEMWPGKRLMLGTQWNGHRWLR